MSDPRVLFSIQIGRFRFVIDRALPTYPWRLRFLNQASYHYEYWKDWRVSGFYGWEICWCRNPIWAPEFHRHICLRWSHGGLGKLLWTRSETNTP